MITNKDFIFDHFKLGQQNPTFQKREGVFFCHKLHHDLIETRYLRNA